MLPPVTAYCTEWWLASSIFQDPELSVPVFKSSFEGCGSQIKTQTVKSWNFRSMWKRWAINFSLFVHSGAHPRDLRRGPRELLYLEEWGAFAVMSSSWHLHSANRHTLSVAKVSLNVDVLVPKGVAFRAKKEMLKKTEKDQRESIRKQKNVSEGQETYWGVLVWIGYSFECFVESDEVSSVSPTSSNFIPLAVMQSALSTVTCLFWFWLVLIDLLVDPWVCCERSDHVVIRTLASVPCESILWTSAWKSCVMHLGSFDKLLHLLSSKCNSEFY